MLTWFRPGPSRYQTALAMVGAKSGDRVLVAGHPDPALVAEVAHVTGLNGQTTAAGPVESQASVVAAAEKAGVLVDFVAHDRSVGPIPTLAAPTDIVVLAVPLGRLPPDEPRHLVTASLTALRPGGRIVVIDGARPTGLLWRNPSLPASAVDVVALLTAAGAVAARRLGDEPGVAYYEARRARA